MPIINPTPSQTDRLNQQVQIIRSKFNRQYKDLTSLAQEITTLIWNNKDYTAQQVFDAFGKDAADLVKLSDAYITFIKSTTGQSLPSPVPTGKTLTVNADGTVKVS